MHTESHHIRRPVTPWSPRSWDWWLEEGWPWELSSVNRECWDNQGHWDRHKALDSRKELFISTVRLCKEIPSFLRNAEVFRSRPKDEVLGTYFQRTEQYLKEKRKIKQVCHIVDNPWNQGRKNRGSLYYSLYLSLKTFTVEKKEGTNDFEMARCNTAKPWCPRLLIATLAAGFFPCSGSRGNIPTTIAKGMVPFVSLNFVRSTRACLLIKCHKLFSQMAKGWSWKQALFLKGSFCSWRNGT